MLCADLFMILSKIIMHVDMLGAARLEVMAAKNGPKGLTPPGGKTHLYLHLGIFYSTTQHIFEHQICF